MRWGRVSLYAGLPVAGARGRKKSACSVWSRKIIRCAPTGVGVNANRKGRARGGGAVMSDLKVRPPKQAGRRVTTSEAKSRSLPRRLGTRAPRRALVSAFGMTIKGPFERCVREGTIPTGVGTSCIVPLHGARRAARLRRRPLQGRAGARHRRQVAR